MSHVRKAGEERSFCSAMTVEKYDALAKCSFAT